MFGRIKFKMRICYSVVFIVVLYGVIGRYRLSATPEKTNEEMQNEIYHQNSSALLKMSEALHNLEMKVSKLQELSPKPYPRVKKLNYSEKKRILVTGGAGFVGSHLVDVLMRDGHEVTVVDNFFTGSKRNIEHWIGHENFELIRHDIVNPLYIEVDQIYHLASPASPPHYMFNPVKTIKTNTMGTINLLGLARRVGARVLVASTSEVYGDPEVHPQSEDYWGHVNPIGPRSCYDEGKRVAEALCYAYAKQEKVEVRVARIFNTYGPRMHINDGRVVSNFILQALQNHSITEKVEVWVASIFNTCGLKMHINDGRVVRNFILQALQNHSITIYGSGKQTRSFQYVSDLVDGLVALMNSNYSLPINLGNPDEYTIEEFATVIKNIVGGNSPIVKQTGVQDDPQRRKPDIKRAKLYLNWHPKVSLKEGLQKTVQYFEKELLQENAKDSSS